VVGETIMTWKQFSAMFVANNEMCIILVPKAISTNIKVVVLPNQQEFLS
jgi:hypothetical protein